MNLAGTILNVVLIKLPIARGGRFIVTTAVHVSTLCTVIPRPKVAVRFKVNIVSNL